MIGIQELRPLIPESEPAISTSHTILVPLDGSSRSLHAIPFALTLAQGGGKIVLLRVVPEQRGFVPEDTATSYGWFEGADRVRASVLFDEVGALAAQIKKSASFAGEIEGRVTIGDAASEILDIAQTSGFTFIAMTSRSHGAVQRAFAGSVSDRVNHHSTIPVIIARSDDDLHLFTAPISRLLVTLDGSALAENAIPVATGLARQLKIPMVLVRALYVNSMLPPILVSGGVLQEIIDHDRRLANDYFSAVSANVTAEGITVSTVVATGTLQEVIESIAQPGDLVALTSHGRSGVKRWLMGSVAEHLIRTSSLPVLLVPVVPST